ncbi:hypothetical protein KP509_28G057800 [Ceratopteris richardii]|uniref:Pentatricopeptide repeat-containing protein n=1 Tax=Ceratopteris richardii TaxID=49495 RepID=A0A8T2RF27_CERRI|nr:hypothetical protein KP509_28G057800 [Ceratopteris richardii]KAH7294122.1 hypothetical protein KP509_28G057800 [Ceratopteris richardii]KAH7294123.1 hypothetical protein KP509_28G057800 [Ceratopteris richardii]KAH7294124.1 hypothetical protein KP509_28G057800 [Ceratopteris richardii]KAH7294125.1 hypothetical protein KP509_28G057800 [Ceratopteris richardii]
MASAHYEIISSQVSTVKNSRSSIIRRRISNTFTKQQKLFDISVFKNPRDDASSLKKMDIATELANKYATLLRGCDNVKHLAKGRILHQEIRKVGVETDKYLSNLLIQMYGKCGDIQEAYNVFSCMPNKNIFTWNLMIGAYVDNGRYKSALKIFQRMLSLSVIPDGVTLVSALTACTSLLSLAEGKWMHAYILRHGLASNTRVGTAVVNMYAKCGSLDEAHDSFDILTERDAILWNALIVAYAQHTKYREALQYLQDMQMEGFLPTVVTFASILDACASSAALHEGKHVHAYTVHGAKDVGVDTALVNMYARCGQIDVAEELFNNMPEHNLVSWSAMVAAYAQHGHSMKVLQVSRRMQHVGLIPNEVTMISILTACSHAGLIDEARYWFTSMIKDYGISPGEEHYNCMIDMLGRMGRLDLSEELLRSMPVGTSSLPWITFLGACKNHADIKRARYAAEKAMKLDPNNHSPYVQLSNIYCEAGMWQEAEEVRKLMEKRNVEQI